MIDDDEDIEDLEIHVGDNLLTIQGGREGPTNKEYSSTPPSQNNSNEGVQSSLGIHGEEHILKERRSPTRKAKHLS